jgi:Tfp pilus assembly protein PilF
MTTRHSAIQTGARGLAITVLVLQAACGKSADRAGRTPADSATALMERGLTQLYQTNDPVGAQDVFRDVLKLNPTHYGAHYQLAVALDRGGKPAQARAAWEEMRTLAEAIRDTTSLNTIKRRLASPDTASADAMMALGLDYLYKKNDAAAAAQQFRNVIARNPTHYGATYQLAKSLDLLGQRDQATPLWRKVLGMATQYRDDRTIQQARERLR